MVYTRFRHLTKNPRNIEFQRAGDEPYRNLFLDHCSNIDCTLLPDCEKVALYYTECYGELTCDEVTINAGSQDHIPTIVTAKKVTIYRSDRDDDMFIFVREGTEVLSNGKIDVYIREE